MTQKKSSEKFIRDIKRIPEESIQQKRRSELLLKRCVVKPALQNYVDNYVAQTPKF